MSELINKMRELVIANRILAHEGVVDAYGHVTVRHPEDAGRYLMSRSRSPELVSLGDVIQFKIDGTPIDDLGRPCYAERAIHGGVYEARPEVNAVVHNHAYELIPFGVTKKTRLRPIFHVSGLIGAEIPTWEIRDKWGDKTDLLVITMDQGRDLARCLGENTVALMRGHGCVVAGRTIHEAVLASIYLQINARLLLQAVGLGGEITYLSPDEVAAQTKVMETPLARNRAWEYFVRRAGCESL